MTDEMRSGDHMIFGLGNPGRSYRHNRHNAGFLFADYAAEQMGLTFQRLQLRNLVAKGQTQGQRLILAKPQTMMNLSGEAVAPLVRYYRVRLEHVLIVYDDLDLPPAGLRLRAFGSSGGHRGLASVLQHLGTRKVPRLRIGIGRPPGRMDPADYVLQDLSQGEHQLLDQALSRAWACAIDWIREGIEVAMNRCNEPQGT